MEDDNQTRLTANGILSNKKIFLKNFLGGIAWGVGSVIGATVVVAVIIWVLKGVNFVPIIGEFVSSVLEVVEQNQTSPFRRK